MQGEQDPTEGPPEPTVRRTPPPETRRFGTPEPSPGAMSSSQPAAPPEVGEAARDRDAVLGHYVLVEKIGEGGMGEVHRAWDLTLGRWVAIKLLKTRDEETVQRFLREANLAAQLAHPNVTRIYEAGLEDGRAFLAMELIEGAVPLDRRSARRWAAEVVRDAARGVAHAHEHGIVHRDLKPANLLASPDGTVHVTDFGLARSLEEGANLTVSGEVLGTPAYMAPEQARGERGDVRTDVFGLGATLHALVEGRAPREAGGVVELIESAARTPLPGLSGRDDLSVIARKATELDSTDRYASAAELADDLDLYLADEPILARPISSAGRAWRKAKRHPRTSAVLVVLLMGLLVGTVWGVVVARRQAARRALEERADSVLERAAGVLESIRQMQGSGAYEPENLQRALADYGALATDALEIAPDHPPALQHLGTSLLARERYVEAEATFGRILARDSEHDAARSGRARARLLQVPAAPPTATATSAGMEFEPERPGATHAARLQAAAEDFAALPEDHPDTATGVATLAFYEGDYETALELLEARLAAQPYLAPERLMLAHARLVTHAFDAAVEHAELLLRRGYDTSTSRTILAYAHAGRGRFDEAVREMAQVVQQQPDWEHQRNFLAFWMVQLGRAAEALPHYDALLTDQPDDVTYLLGRSLAHQALGDTTAALVDARRACELAPENAEAHWSRGGALTGSEEGIAAYDRAIELDPAYAAAYGQRGFNHLLLEHHAEAEADGRKAIELESDYAQWRFVRAMALVGLDRLEEAESELDRGEERGLDPGTLHLLRGRVRWMRNDCRGALTDFEAAVRLGETVDAETLEAVRAECAR